MKDKLNITVVGMGYVGLSLAVLLSQRNRVTIVDVIDKKVNSLNNYTSPVGDDLIQQYLDDTEDGSRLLDLTATTDTSSYATADFVVIAVQTNYDPYTNQFDTKSVDRVVGQVLEANSATTIVIKSTVPVGYTEELRKRTGANILFSPEFLRESKALYDNLYPSRIIVGCSRDFEDRSEVVVDNDNASLITAARSFSGLLSEAALNDPEVLLMSSTEAEAVKLFANTYLTLRVSFFNELDTYAEVKACGLLILSAACALIRVLVISIIIHHLGTVGIACRKTQNNCWQITRMYHRI